MTFWEQTWAADVLAAFAPVDPSDARTRTATTLAPRDGEVDYASVFFRLMRGSTPVAALGLRFALWMVAFAPFWLWGRFSTFSKLGRTERTELLSRLLRHGSHVVRELALLLKFAAAVALLGTPSVRARSGYDNAQPPANVERDTGRRQLPLLEPGARVSLPPTERAAS
jgi:hypothetical protein